MRPFSNGSQYMDWLEANCCTCDKGSRNGDVPTCEIELALSCASWDDGDISDDIVKRMNADKAYPNNYYNWPCEEHVPGFNTEKFFGDKEGE